MNTIDREKQLAITLKNHWVKTLDGDLFYPIKGDLRKDPKSQKIIPVLTDGVKYYYYRDLWLPKIGEKVTVDIYDENDTAGLITLELAKSLKGSKKKIFHVELGEFEVVGGGMKRHKSGEIAYAYLSDESGNEYPITECFCDISISPGASKTLTGIIVEIEQGDLNTKTTFLKVQTEEGLVSTTISAVKKVAS